MAMLSPTGCLKGEATEPVVKKFAEKMATLHKTIVIKEAGVYDYGKVMHSWRGGGSCGFLGAHTPVLIVRASNVTVKNFGFRDAVSGIYVEAGVRNIRLDNIEGHACGRGLFLPPSIEGFWAENVMLIQEQN